jgi:hypothetical protein
MTSNEPEKSRRITSENVVNMEFKRKNKKIIFISRKEE